MTSLTSMAMHSDDLCHDPHRAEKCDGKGHFSSHCFELFKNPPPKKVLRKGKKKETCPFVQLPLIQKHNRVKSVLKSGEEPGSSVPFSPPQSQRGIIVLFLCPRRTQWALPSIHAAHWSRQSYVTMKLRTWEVYHPRRQRLDYFPPAMTFRSTIWEFKLLKHRELTLSTSCGFLSGALCVTCVS